MVVIHQPNGTRTILGTNGEHTIIRALWEVVRNPRNYRPEDFGEACHLLELLGVNPD